MHLAGILSPIESVLTDVLEWFHTSIGLTWAWAIVAVTVLVRFVILPLTVQQIRSMQRLAIFAPQLKALQERYKGDRQRLNEEVMKFYKEHKVNPAASCLPILPQIPVFISLFYVLRTFDEKVLPNYPVSDISFLNGFVADITDPIDASWQGWVLLVIYGVTQLLSMYLSTTTLQSKGQRILMLVLPVVFIPVVIHFPVGLLVYWMTTNFWTIGQGIVTRRVFPRPPIELPKRTSRTPTKAAPSTPPPSAGKKSGRPPRPQPASGEPGAPRPVRRRKKRGPQPRR